MLLDPIQSLLRAPLLEGRRTRRASHTRMSTNLWEHNTIYYKIDKGFGKFHFTVSVLRIFQFSRFHIKQINPLDIYTLLEPITPSAIVANSFCMSRCF